MNAGNPFAQNKAELRTPRRRSRGSILIGAIIAMLLVVAAYFVYDSMIQAARDAGKREYSEGGGRVLREFVKGDTESVQQAIYEEAAADELQKAVLENRTEDVALLLEGDIPINRRNSSGSTALHRTAYNDSVDIARLLLEHGADPDIQDKNGSTPLHIAASRAKPNPVLVELLVKKMVNPDVKDVQGRTPLHLAIERGCRDSVWSLVNYGAGVNEKNGDGKSPLALARGGGNQEMVQILTSAGAEK